MFENFDSKVALHRLSVVGKELGLSDEMDFDKIIDHIFLSLLTVISSVHSAEIVHRDVKPQNLLLDPVTKVRLSVICYY